MAHTRWHEETKLLIALWREGAVQNELNTMRNKKIVWDKIRQGMADRGYSRTAQQRGRVKGNNLKQKYCKIGDGNKISGNQRQEWEMFELMDRVPGERAFFLFSTLDSEITLPRLFVFSQM